MGRWPYAVQSQSTDDMTASYCTVGYIWIVIFYLLDIDDNKNKHVDMQQFSSLFYIYFDEDMAVTLKWYL